MNEKKQYRNGEGIGFHRLGIPLLSLPRIFLPFHWSIVCSFLFLFIFLFSSSQGERGEKGDSGPIGLPVRIGRRRGELFWGASRNVFVHLDVYIVFRSFLFFIGTDGFARRDGTNR